MFSFCSFFSISATLPGSDDDAEQSTVSLCQVRVQFDGTHEFDDRTLLALLSALKMHDFFIGQPVWGPADTLFYLCEHRLKIGLRQTILDKELRDVLKNTPGSSSARLAWSCA